MSFGDSANQFVYAFWSRQHLIENKMMQKQRKLKVKQPGIEEEEDMMSRHLDAVATSALNQKHKQQQLTRRKTSRRHQLKKEGRDIIQRSRHQCTEKEVAITYGCRDINC